eukprot:8974773-Pyramimonas_sp.AAC.1
MFQVCPAGAPFEDRPRARWTPAHGDLDSLLFGERSPSLDRSVDTAVFDYLGNMWADFFAKLGAKRHA